MARELVGWCARVNNIIPLCVRGFFVVSDIEREREERVQCAHEDIVRACVCVCAYVIVCNRSTH